MNEEPEPIVVGMSGVPHPDDAAETSPPVTFDVDAVYRAVQKLGKREIRAIKQAHERADKKRKRASKQSRRRNRGR